MFSFFQSSRPLIAVCALVLASMFAADSVVIRPGDTLAELALEHDVSAAELREWNNIDDPDRIVAGTVLFVSPPDAPLERYVVQPGDTLAVIAARYRTTISKVVGTNGIADPDLIIAGQTLDLTGDGTPPESAPATGSYVVAPGDTLSEIAEDHGIRTSALAAANDITDRNLVRIGRSLVVPGPTAPAAAPADAPPAPAPAETAAEAPVADPTTPAAPATPEEPPVPAPTTTAAPAPTPAPAAAAGAEVLTPLFARWAGVYGVDQSLLEAIASVESDWRPEAIGSGGQLGIGQLSPETVTFVEERLLGLDVNPLAASDGIRLSARYLRYLLDRTPSERDALAAWNQGLASIQGGGISESGGAFADSVLQTRQARS